MTDDDVPAGVDFRSPDQTAAWIAATEIKRPHRAELRRIIAARVAAIGRAKLQILELGGGPGFLAETILAACDVARYVLLDFAPPMLAAAKQRLGDRVTCQLDDFLDPAWPSRAGGPFDAVVSMQAIHELRHKRRAQLLYEQARTVMRPGAVLVVCDHEPMGKPRTDALYATVAEQHAAMSRAGFTQVASLATIAQMYVIAASTRDDVERPVEVVLVERE